MARHIFPFVLMIIILPVAGAGASTITDYQNRLEAAQKQIEIMTSMIEGDAGAREYRLYLRDTEASIKASLPEGEKIDINGASIETSNGWLRASFERFDQSADTDERIEILSSIGERLAAIDAHVRDLDTAAASTRSKDEDKQKLSEILRREEYQKPEEKEKSLFQRWLEWFLNWLSGIFPKPNIAPVNPSVFQPLSIVIQVLIYGMIIALLGFLIYKFAPVIAERFRKRAKTDVSERIILGEHIDGTISAKDLFSEAERLARGGDLRGAIRKGYVALLCDLADKKVIGLARHKTNRDYLRDVRKRATLFERMKHATGSFERHWYGLAAPAPKDWEEFSEQYRAALSEAGR